MHPEEMIAGVDRSLVDLEQRLAAVEREKLALAAALDGLKEARARLVALRTGAGAPAEGSLFTTAGTQDAPVPPPAEPAFGRQTHTQTVLCILREAGRPLTAAELARAIGERGHPGSGKVLRDIVHSVVRRREDLFRKIRREGRVLWEEVKKPTAAGHHHGNGAPRPHDEQPPSKKGDLTGRTIEEAARIILSGHGNVPMHYRDIAAEAQRRGYTSWRSPEVAPSSFLVVLDRKKAVFEKLGEGKFRVLVAEEASKA